MGSLTVGSGSGGALLSQVELSSTPGVVPPSLGGPFEKSPLWGRYRAQEGHIGLYSGTLARSTTLGA